MILVLSKLSHHVSRGGSFFRGVNEKMFCCNKSIADKTDEEATAAVRLLALEEEDNDSPVPTTKFVFIGDTAAGKSSIIRKLCNNTFSENEISTVGIDFKSIQVECNGQTHRLMLWDTAGQKRFQTTASTYYKNADYYVVVYDLGDKNSGKHVPDWMRKIEEHTEKRKPYRIVVGNKLDLEKRELDINKLESVINNAEQYVETSAKTGLNLDRLLKHMAVVADKKFNKDD